MTVRDPQDETAWRYTLGRVGRHLQWVRTQGIGRLVEEDQLDPVARFRTARAKRRWRTQNVVAPGQARPVWVVGVQRSGTNMVVRGLESAPCMEVRNENDQAAFTRFRLREDAVIRELITSSQHSHILFKPLCDSHDVVRMLSDLRGDTDGRAVWVFRDMDGRVRSALAKFGTANLAAMRAIAAGRGDGLWQAQGLSEDSRELIEKVEWDTASAATAAALFWYVRNRLWFELGLDERQDATIVSYNQFLTDPEGVMRPLSRFLDLDYDPAYHAHMQPRSAPISEPLEIDPMIRERCDALNAELEDAALARRRRLDDPR